MRESPEYFTAATLASAAGVSRSQLTRHQQRNVGQIMDAREMVPGLGLRYRASKCRKYLALVKAGRGQHD